MEEILASGARLIAAIQNLGEWQVPLMKFFTFLGTEEFYMLVLPVLYWCLSAPLGARVAVILMLSGGINDALKLAFHAPRPYWYSPQVKSFAIETSFGAPSGHAQNAVAVWGIVAAYLKQRWVWLVAILLMFLIGFSRLSLGVHFPHDVILGWLTGSLLLWLMVRGWEATARRVARLSPGRRVLLAFLASLTLMTPSAILFTWLKDNWQPPAEWAAGASRALSTESMLTTGGALFGLLAGMVWLERAGGFQTRGSWWQLAARYLAGAAGVLVIRYGLKALFPADETLVAYLLRYLRYALIGLWITGGAPLLFVRFGLAERARSLRQQAE